MQKTQFIVVFVVCSFFLIKWKGVLQGHSVDFIICEEKHSCL